MRDVLLKVFGLLGVHLNRQSLISDVLHFVNGAGSFNR